MMIPTCHPHCAGQQLKQRGMTQAQHADIAHKQWEQPLAGAAATRQQGGRWQDIYGMHDG